MSNPNQADETSPAPPVDAQEEYASNILNVGGDQVTQVTAELPEDQKENIRWLYSLAKSQKWSGPRLSKECGIDSTTLYRVFTGKYAAKLGKISERIERYRRQFEDEAQRSRGQDVFVETSIAKRFGRDSISRATRRRSFSFTGRRRSGRRRRRSSISCSRKTITA